MTISKIEDMIARCSRCGKCRSVCPVFAEIPSEPYVARGKVQLLRALLEGVLEPTEKYRELISFCLLCGQCSEMCPNGVKTEDIVLKARSELVDKKGLPFIKRNVFQHFLNSNGKLNLTARLLYIYQRSGLQYAVRKTGLLPGELGEKEKLLPNVSAVFLREELRRLGRVQDGTITISPLGEVKHRVGYFTGCMSQYVFTETAKNVIKILNKAGVEVVVPEQYCCGMPTLTAGGTKNTVELARKNIESFRRAAHVDVVVTDCATCGSALKIKYPDLLGQDLPFKVYDICQYLVKYADIKCLLSTAGFNKTTGVLVESCQCNSTDTGDYGQYKAAKVTYHDPCHLARYMKVKEEPREFLRSIPGLELIEMRDSDRCCGASGSFQLEHQRLSAKIGEHKAKNIEETGARIVATGCPSCRLQLSRVLRERGSDVKVVHPVDLLFK